MSLLLKCSNRFSQMQNSQKQKPFSSVLPEKVYPVSMRVHSKYTQRKLATHKKTSRGKISRRNLVIVAKKINLEAQKKRFVVKKGLQLLAVITPPVNNHLS